MTTELQILEQNSNAIIEAFKTDGGAQSLFDRMAEQARSVVPDLSTDKGRKAIASMARKVASSKTAFDAHGKELKEQYTVITSKIDADRKLFRDQCDALRDEIRKPLTDWEQAEKDRVSGHKQCIQDIRDMLKEAIELGFNSNQIQSSINHLENIIIDFDGWEEFTQEAHIAKLETLELLRKALAEREKYEAEQAELERLRQAEQVRLQQERDAQIAREATEKAQREAEQKARFEADRVQREKLESEQREAKLKHEAEQALIREKQLKEQAEQQARQAEIDKALAIERAEQAAKQAEHNKQLAVQAERERIERETKAKEEAERKEQEAREANKAHKKDVCDSILVELAKLSIDEKTGQDLIKAIYNNQIPNIKITF